LKQLVTVALGLFDMPSPCVDITTTRTIRLRTAPEWLPEKFRKRLTRQRLSFRPCKGERHLLKRRKKEAPSVWAPKNRTVTYGPLKGSRWDNSFMPHMRGIMDASFFPSVRMIGNIKVPQSGSSAGAETMIGYIADTQPGAALITYPDRDTTSKRSTDYLQPMFRNSPRLRKLLTGSSDDLSSLRINLQTMLIYMGWAGSVSSLGNVSARYLFGDEIDKWPAQPSKKEAPSLKLFLERYRSYRYGAKCWLISTPTLVTGPIWQYCIHEADVLFTYHVTCQDCSTHQPLGFDQVRWPEDVRDPQLVEQGNLAGYVCLECGSVWSDRQREKALQAGIWHAYGKGVDWVRDTDCGKKALAGDGRELMTYLRAVHPEKIAFHSPALVTPLVGHSEMAASFLRGLKNVGDMHYFDTQIRGVAHIPSRQNRAEDAIYVLADDRPDRLVPGMGQVAALVATADTQDDGFHYQITAIGWGLNPDRWQIRYGFTRTKAELIQFMFEDTYQDAEGLYYPVHLLVIDSGGHRTSEIYDFTRCYPGRAQAYKGASGRKANPQTWTTIDRYPGTKVQIPGGVKLLIADANHYKDQLASILKVKPDDPGAWHLLASVNDHDVHGRDFAAQMCAEYVDERNMWQCPDGKANHQWDCSMMTLVAEDILQIKYWQKG